MLAGKAAHPIYVEKLIPEEMMQAMIGSFGGEETTLGKVIGKLID